MVTVSRLTGEDVSSRYEALDEGDPGPLFTEYQAHDRGANRSARVRVVHGALANPALLDAIAAEMRRIADLSHPAIERVLDLVAVNRTLAVVVEPHRGADLAERLRKVGPFPVAYAVDVATAVAEALQTAHRAGVLHGNLQPADVYLSAEGIVKICRLGILPAVTSVSAHSRPESLAAAAAPTPRDDLQGFGRLLFALLTGSIAASEEEIAAGPAAQNGRVPTALSNLTRCLTTGDARYGSMEEVLRDLRSVRDAIRNGRIMPSISPPAPRDAGGKQRSKRRQATDVLAEGSPPNRRNGSRRHHEAGDRSPAGHVRGSNGAAAGIRRLRPGDAVRAARSRRPDRPPVRLRTRILKAVAWLVFFLVLIPGAAVGAFFYLQYLAGTPEVTIPLLRGKTLEQAREILKDEGLKLEIDPYLAFDSRVPPGAVLRQTPVAGVHTKPPRTVRVFLSRGSRTVSVPSIEGQPQEDAARTVEAAGLQLKSNGSQSSPTVSAGDILKQFPPPGKVVPRDSRVWVLVSAGPSEQDMEEMSSPEPLQRTILLNIPGSASSAKPGTRTDVKDQSGKPQEKQQEKPPAKLHYIKILERGPAGDDKILWQGTALPGAALEQDVTVDPYSQVRVILDGQELKTRFEHDAEAPAAIPAVDSSPGA